MKICPSVPFSNRPWFALFIRCTRLRKRPLLLRQENRHVNLCYPNLLRSDTIHQNYVLSIFTKLENNVQLNSLGLLSRDDG